MMIIRYRLTGEQIIQSVRYTAMRRAVLNGLLFIFCILFFGGLGIELFRNLKEYWFFLFTTPVWFLCFYCSAKAFRQHYQEFCLGSENETFLRYGSPDEVAAVLSDPQNIQLLSSSRVVFTQAYIMKHKDYLTYVPLSELEQVRVSATSGRNPQAYLEVFLKSGDSRRYRFEPPAILHSAAKQTEEIRTVLREYMPRYAPDCRII